jgi:zinc-ribbon domain
MVTRPRLVSTMSSCPNCGLENAEGVKFCGECGTKPKVGQTPPAGEAVAAPT